MANTCTPKIVVFDLGGVLTRICYTWQDAAEVAGVELTLPKDGNTPMSALPEFDAFQNGQVELDDYLNALTEFTGCPRDHALRLHNSIIVELFPGIEELVLDIEAAGLQTGALSNTNEPHWQDAAFSGRFPPVVRIRHKMASHRVGMSKPDTKIFLHYAQTFGFAPEEIIYFDDLMPNVAGAQSAGFNAFRVDPNQNPAAQMRAQLTALSVLN